MSLTQITDSLEDFERWLQGREDQAIVGMSATPWACPLARYFREKYGVRFEVDSDEIHIYDGASVRSAVNVVVTPDWARKIVEDIDSEEVGYNVTKERALMAVRYASA